MEQYQNINSNLTIAHSHNRQKVQCTIIRRIPIVFFDKSIIIIIPIIIYFRLYEFAYCRVCYLVTSLVILS